MAEPDPEKRYTLVIHGGAGGGAAESGKVVEVDAERSQLLEDALRAGATILANGGNALDAVEAAVMSMEDCPAFNAGRGSVFTSMGTHEMDASIMDGAALRCGAVAGLANTRNPILAARYVMDKTPHVFFAGKGAEAIATQAGLVQEPQEYFGTMARREQLRKAKEEGKTTLSEDGKATGSSGRGHASRHLGRRFSGGRWGQPFRCCEGRGELGGIHLTAQDGKALADVV